MLKTTNLLGALVAVVFYTSAIFVFIFRLLDKPQVEYWIDFRNVQWMVISYVVLFFAGTGGMLGVARNAGRGWTILAVSLFLVMAALAFIQRAVTGM